MVRDPRFRRNVEDATVNQPVQQDVETLPDANVGTPDAGTPEQEPEINTTETAQPEVPQDEVTQPEIAEQVPGLPEPEVPDTDTLPR